MSNKERYQILFNKINQYNTTGGKGVTRVAYTNEEQTCTHAFMRMCKAEKLDIRMDACGNVIARREGRIQISSTCCDGFPFGYCVSRR